MDQKITMRACDRGLICYRLYALILSLCGKAFPIGDALIGESRGPSDLLECGFAPRVATAFGRLSGLLCRRLGRGGAAGDIKTARPNAAEFDGRPFQRKIMSRVLYPSRRED